MFCEMDCKACRIFSFDSTFSSSLVNFAVGTRQQVLQAKKTSSRGSRGVDRTRVETLSEVERLDRRVQGSKTPFKGIKLKTKRLLVTLC